jgi:perosamine synthetase
MAHKKTIPISIPNITGNEQKYLTECIDTKFVSSVGRFVTEFEKQLEFHSGFKHACAVNSGTSALSLSLHNVGASHNDLVIIPDYTFIATANAVAHCGATPWILDISSTNLNLDLQKLRSVLDSNCELRGGNWFHKDTGQRIAAIVPVLALGNSCDVNELNDIYKDYSIPVIVDAAGALGLEPNKQKLGNINVTCLTISFNGNKTFTSGGGGAIITNDSSFFELCKHTSTTARSGYEYKHDEIGFNHRMTNLQAAVGCAQLERYHEFVDKKSYIHNFYQKNIFLSGVGSMHRSIDSSRWISYILFNNDANINLENLYLYMQNKGIELRPFWVPMHMQEPFKNCLRENLDVTKSLFQNVCTLPSSTGITDDELSYTVSSINSFLGDYAL